MIIRPRPSPSRFATARFKAQTTTLWRCCLAKKAGGEPVRGTGDKRRRHHMRLSFKKDGLPVPCRAMPHHICWPFFASFSPVMLDLGGPCVPQVKPAGPTYCLGSRR